MLESHKHRVDANNMAIQDATKHDVQQGRQGEQSKQHITHINNEHMEKIDKQK